MASAQQNKVPSEEMSLVVQKQAIVTLNNNGSASLKLNRSNNWSGSPEGGAFPANVSADGDVKFTHLSGPTNGSMAMVQYSGVSKYGKPVSIIVAWDAPYNYNPPNVPNRVYTYCNYSSIFNTITLDEILMSLEQSSTSTDCAQIVNQASGDAVVTVTVDFDGWT